MWHISPRNILYLCAFILLNSRDWKRRLINVGNKILAVANTGGCSDKPLLIAVSSLVFNYPKPLQVYGRNVCRTWHVFALFIQRLTFSDIVSEISAKICLGLHSKFALLPRDLGQNVKVSTVKLPNIFSYVNCIEGLFLCFTVREGRLDHSSR